MASYGFHSGAADEYLAATRYYLDKASPLIAATFVAEVEAAIKILLAAPTTWAVIEEPQIRRYLLKQFPYNLVSLGAQAGPSFDLRSCTSVSVLVTGVSRQPSAN